MKKVIALFILTVLCIPVLVSARLNSDATPELFRVGNETPQGSGPGATIQGDNEDSGQKDEDGGNATADTKIRNLENGDDEGPELEINRIEARVRSGENQNDNSVGGTDVGGLKENAPGTFSNRRSRVAIAVSELLKVADRTGGIGEKIRVIAQNQNEIQEKAENSLSEVKKRSGFTKFFIGPNYKKINEVKAQLEIHKKRIKELKEIKEQVQHMDGELIQEQIKIMEGVTTELEESISSEKKGFSLFGWLNRIISK
jgi:hypothetical protein